MKSISLSNFVLFLSSISSMCEFDGFVGVYSPQCFDNKCGCSDGRTRSTHPRVIRLPRCKNIFIVPFLWWFDFNFLKLLFYCLLITYSLSPLTNQSLLHIFVLPDPQRFFHGKRNRFLSSQVTNPLTSSFFWD